MAMILKNVGQNQQTNPFLNLTRVTNSNNNNQPVSLYSGVTNQTSATKTQYSEDSLYNNSFFDTDIIDLHTSQKTNTASNPSSSYNSMISGVFNFDNTAFYAEVNQKLKDANTANTNTTGTSATSNSATGDFYSEVNQKLSDISAIFGLTEDKGSSSTTNSTANPFANFSSFSSFSLEDIASNGLSTVGNLTSADVDLSIMSYQDNTEFYKSVNENLNKSGSSSTNKSNGSSNLSSTMSQFKGYGDYNSFPAQPKSSNLKKCKHQKNIYKDKSTGKYWQKTSSGWYVEVSNPNGKKGHK